MDPPPAGGPPEAGPPHRLTDSPPGESEDWEEVCLGPTRLSLPAGLCHRSDILDQFFHPDLWDELTPELQGRLRARLPEPEAPDEGRQQVRALLAGQNLHFGNALTRFKRDLAAGECAPEPTRVRRLLRRVQRRQYRERMRERAYLLLQEMLTSRKRLIESRTGQPARTPLSVLKLERKSVRATPDLEFQVAQRYLRERDLIAREGGSDVPESEDEFYPAGPPARKPPRREVNLLDSDYWQSFTVDRSLHQTAPTDPAPADPAPEPSLQSLNAAGFQRVPQSSVTAPPKAAGESLLTSSSGPPRPAVQDKRVIEEAVANIPGLGDLIRPADHDLMAHDVVVGEETVETSDHAGGEPDVDVVIAPPGPLCYFSLLRDRFALDPNSRITIPELEAGVVHWQSTTQRSECDWIHLASSWVAQIPSAVAFLTGAFPEAQPQGFRAFITCDPHQGTYQWVGSGRDSEVNLCALTQWWLERRDKCRATTTTSSEEPTPPTELPPPPSLPVEVRGLFQAQEKERFAHPNRAYTYRRLGAQSVVGPLKITAKHNIKTHPLLLSQRPPYITMVVLVRDAVARLTHGFGSRNDIVDLLKESQYLNGEALGDANALSQCVSGALDRLQSEIDPCVKYDGTKKIWTNLHFHRTEEEFVHIHQQQLAAQVKPPKRGDLAKKEAHLTSQIPSNILENAIAVATQSVAHPQVDLPPMKLPLMSTVPSITGSPTKSLPIPIASSGSQTVQVMTSQGLKTFQLSSPSSQTVSAMDTTTKMTSILNKGPETSPKVGSPSAQSLLIPQNPTTSPPKQPSKPILPKASLPSSPMPMASSLGGATSLLQSPPSARIQRPLQQTGLAPVFSASSLGMAQQSTPIFSAASGSPQVQRVIVKNSEGKHVQLSPAQLQKLIASGAIKQGAQIAMDKGSVKVLQQQQQQQQPPSLAVSLDATVSNIVSRTMSTAPMSTLASHGLTTHPNVVISNAGQSIRVAHPSQSLLAQSQISGQPTHSPIVRLAQGGNTQPIRYLNLSQASPATTGNLLKILGSTGQAQQVRVIQAPGHQSIRLAPTTTSSIAAGSSLLQPQQQIQLSLPNVVSTALPAAPQPMVTGPTTSIRLNRAITPGQRVIVGGKEYLLATNAAGQQVLTPVAHPQTLGQSQTLIQQPQVVIQSPGTRSVMLNPTQAAALQNIRIIQQPK